MSATARTSLAWNASSAAHSRNSLTGHASTRGQTGSETRDPKEGSHESSQIVGIRWAVGIRRCTGAGDCTRRGLGEDQESLRDLHRRVPEEYRDLIHGNSGEQHLDRKGVAEHVGMATLQLAIEPSDISQLE